MLTIASAAWPRWPPHGIQDWIGASISPPGTPSVGTHIWNPQYYSKIKVWDLDQGPDAKMGRCACDAMRIDVAARNFADVNKKIQDVFWYPRSPMPRMNRRSFRLPEITILLLMFGALFLCVWQGQNTQVGVPNKVEYRAKRDLFLNDAPTLRGCWLGPMAPGDPETLDRVRTVDMEVARRLASVTQWRDGWKFSRDGHITIYQTVCAHFLFGSNTWVRVMYFMKDSSVDSLGYTMLRDSSDGLPDAHWDYGPSEDYAVPEFAHAFRDIVRDAGGVWIRGRMSNAERDWAKMMPQEAGTTPLTPEDGADFFDRVYNRKEANGACP